MDNSIDRRYNYGIDLNHHSIDVVDCRPTALHGMLTLNAFVLSVGLLSAINTRFAVFYYTLQNL